jgi:hypothetical protein
LVRMGARYMRACEGYSAPPGFRNLSRASSTAAGSSSNSRSRSQKSSHTCIIVGGQSCKTASGCCCCSRTRSTPCTEMLCTCIAAISLHCSHSPPPPPAAAALVT